MSAVIIGIRGFSCLHREELRERNKNINASNLVKEKDKGIIKKISKDTNESKRDKEIGGERPTRTWFSSIILRVDVCAPWVVENGLDADTSLDITVQHLANQVDAVLAHDIWYS